MAILEICCYSIDGALTAQQAGADRIELCAGINEGGLTPSFGMLHTARQHVSIPVHPIVRPRGGDFCYTAAEFAVLKSDVAFIRELGFPGLVVGILDEDARIDRRRMQELMAVCGEMAVTFHRAFDVCSDPQRARDELADLGIRRILTSGQQASAEKGLPLLQALARRQGPTIMAGAGVRLSNLQKFIDAGISELHSSAGRYLAPVMQYRPTGVSMSARAGADEFGRYGVDGDMVAAMAALLHSEHP